MLNPRVASRHTFFLGRRAVAPLGTKMGSGPIFLHCPPPPSRRSQQSPRVPKYPKGTRSGKASLCLELCLWPHKNRQALRSFQHLTSIPTCLPLQSRAASSHAHIGWKWVASHCFDEATSCICMGRNKRVLSRFSGDDEKKAVCRTQKTQFSQNTTCHAHTFLATEKGSRSQ